MASISSSLVIILYITVDPRPHLSSVQWLMNGTRLEDLNLTNVPTEFREVTRQGTLVFNNISVEYNNTNIQCRATLSNEETVDSNNVTLLVQGERE